MTNEFRAWMTSRFELVLAAVVAVTATTGSACDSAFCESNADCRAKPDFAELRYGICSSDGESCGPCPAGDETECVLGSAAPTSGAGAGGGSATSGPGGGQLCTPKDGSSCEHSSECACGEGCLKAANCETCSMYCMYPCDTDEDCTEWSKGLDFPHPTCNWLSSGLFKICEP